MQRHRGLDLLPQGHRYPIPRLPQGDGDAAPRDVRRGRAWRRDPPVQRRRPSHGQAHLPRILRASRRRHRRHPPRTRQRHGRELQQSLTRKRKRLRADFRYPLAQGGPVGVRPQIPRRDAAGRPQGKAQHGCRRPPLHRQAMAGRPVPQTRCQRLRPHGRRHAPRRPLRLRQTEARLGLGPRGPGELRVRQRDRIARSPRVS